MMKKAFAACFQNKQACSNSSSAVKMTASLILLLMVTSVMSGCGFHLRGYDSGGQAQFKSVKLTDLQSVQGDVADALRQQLKASGVVVTPNLAGAELEVSFARTYSHRSKTSYTGTGDVSSVLLTMKQAFEVQEVATESLLLRAEVSSYRDHQINNNALLASNRELEAIQQQMARDLARQIVERINRALITRNVQDEALKTPLNEDKSSD
ncbi:LPS-assembly lipoprotein LptE [Thiomicrorhabdus chilensis]|uniref:LPS-assembly lipoprotein LptE n=1 Tax=Thiomicrorhabdus chilensis TaxID=63656 RepID=UPI00040F7658|nr:LPS assembly lipoprotein LptE [Thiomicrorhabdus chilensis]